MESGKSRWLMRILAASVFVSVFGFGVIAQDDPDPNSPTPVLMSMKDPMRALAVSQSDLGRVKASRSSARAFELNSKVVLFVSNISLMDGEGAAAFRVYVQDVKGRNYRFPVLDIAPSSDGIYEVTILTTDELGFWEPPAADGDVLVQVAWRGLGSNRLRLGLGKIGGGIKDDPAPIDTAGAKNTTAAGKKSRTSPISPEYIGYRWSGDRMRFLEQATFGPTSALDTRIRRIGLRTWLAEQFDAPYPTSTNPYPSQPLKPANQPTDCDGGADDIPLTCNRDTYSMYPVQTWFMREAFYGDAQLRHRVAWALGQIIVTSGADIQQSRHMVEYHKILSANAFGNFRNLLGPTAANPTGGMTLHPTMGDYLSMALSTKNSPNENYAREIMQLFSVGLFMLNQDGTLQFDGTGNPIPTYDQNVVNNLTKVLTGWSFCQTPGATCPNVAIGSVNYIDPMLLNTGNHDLTAKTLLSYTGSTTTNIAACAAPCTSVTDRTTYANASMRQALDNIFNHPNVGPFIGKTMIQHMVTSDPTPAYVSRVAAVFNDNGFGVRGDMKAVVKAILLDPEARGDVKTDPNYGKLREPVQLTTNFLRGFNVKSADGLSQSDGFLTGRGEFTGMAEVPFFSPTVFNYFPPGYIVPGTAMLGPEFAILTTGTTIQRANFMNRFIFTAPAIGGGTTDSPAGLSVDFSDLQTLASGDTTSNSLLDELDRRMLHSTMTPAMRSSILTAVNAITVSNPPTAAQTLSRARQAVYLVATSTQYQVQR